MIQKSKRRKPSKGFAIAASADGQSDRDLRFSRRLLSKQELSLALGVSGRTIDNWVAQRRIPRLRLSPRMTRFNLSKVETALERYEIREAGRQ